MYLNMKFLKLVIEKEVYLVLGWETSNSDKSGCENIKGLRYLWLSFSFPLTILFSLYVITI